MDRSWDSFCVLEGYRRHRWERVLFQHDEYALHVDTEIAESVGESGVDSIRLAGEFYNLRVPLTGEAKTGPTYASVH